MTKDPIKAFTIIKINTLVDYLIILVLILI